MLTTFLSTNISTSYKPFIGDNIQLIVVEKLSTIPSLSISLFKLYFNMIGSLYWVFEPKSKGLSFTTGVKTILFIPFSSFFVEKWPPFSTYSLSGKDIVILLFEDISDVLLYKYTNVESDWLLLFSFTLQSSSPTGIIAIGLLNITLYPLPLSL